MNRRRTTLFPLALATMLVGSAMAASPRDTPEYYVSPPPETSEEWRNRRAGEMEVALRRLVGKFGIERPWVFSQPPPPPNAPRTMWDCVAIGAGTGVHCVVVSAQPRAAPAGQAGAGRTPPSPDRPLRVRVPSTASSVTEYGIDPNASKVRLMTVNRSSAVRMDGRASSNTLTVWGQCWDSSDTCAQRMTAIAGSEDIRVTEYRNWEPRPRYILRRLSQQQADAANWNVEGPRPIFPRKPGRPR